ncbi:FlgN [Sulfuricella sp. T08]|uniref:flagella synthesis protein FlgN n=1 Tax=Sulfuricella sp. T08 TaxID=1632857 RepID=UPI0006179667|nr:flagellar protein FlgN [Sulfuricella sp. T08]GAO37522.1 FlgN [Sulfuricella sp. T08]
MTVNPAIASPSDLVKNLEAELRAFQDFIKVLQTEQDALVQGNVDPLLELARIKSEKVVLLSQLAENRARFLSALGYPQEQGGMMKWLQQRDGGNPHIAELWQQLLALAENAQQLNQINGSMIDTQLRNNQQALAILQAAANQSALYGPDGQTQALGLGRPIGKV